MSTESKENLFGGLKSIVTVYEWESDLAKGIAGHLAMRTYAGGTDGNGYYMSYTPASGAHTPVKALVTQSFKAMTGCTLKSDIESEYGRLPSRVIHLWNLDVECINKAYEDVISNPNFDYNLFFGNGMLKKENKSNCVGLVLHLLKAGGLGKIVDCNQYFAIAEGRLNKLMTILKFLPLIAAVLVISLIFFTFLAEKILGIQIRGGENFASLFEDIRSNWSELYMGPALNAYKEIIVKPSEVGDLLDLVQQKTAVFRGFCSEGYRNAQQVYEVESWQAHVELELCYANAKVIPEITAAPANWRNRLTTAIQKPFSVAVPSLMFFLRVTSQQTLKQQAEKLTFNVNNAVTIFNKRQSALLPSSQHVDCSKLAELVSASKP